MAPKPQMEKLKENPPVNGTEDWWGARERLNDFST